MNQKLSTTRIDIEKHSLINCLAFLSLSLPETLGKPMIETIADFRRMYELKPDELAELVGVTFKIDPIITKKQLTRLATKC